MSGPTSPCSNAETSHDAAAKPRMLVLCFDGTANEYGGENTNVVKFFAMLRKDCDDEQLCYYQTGIGTYENPGMFTPLTMWIAKVADEAFAWYLSAHVMGGYKFLMKNYQPGDNISIFGFSRGAYTARALAGMLTKIGLLPKDNDEQVTFAYKMYTRTDKQGLIEAAGFKQTFCRPVQVRFIGVWETVASTGIIMSRDLPFTTNNTLVKTFRHALSLDEHRSKFVPTFWQLAKPTSSASNPGSAGSSAVVVPIPQNPEDTSTANRDSAVPTRAVTQTSDVAESRLLKSNEKENNKERARKKRTWTFFSKTKTKNAEILDEIDPEESPEDKCDVKEVWFSGCHSDVGGGADASMVTASLADIPLRWMIREVIASQCGIQFDTAAMQRFHVHVDLPAPSLFAPTTHPADGELSAEDASSDAVDASKPLHDELSLQPLWWVLEVIPLAFSWQDAKGIWHNKWELHLGRGRYVKQTGPLLFHETVRIRMEDKTLGYTPKAKYIKGTETYVW
ncbi:hypothetical protein EW145_g852 [Phellinidium pouzarii]|uniref:T6SS Phospholipase effector Tle1-like catalytic domain-containing protein n=1 Tax=Phellinidium pouzarii TaxID=167371 RepID=A0A4S4LGS8_9AGAM|nr:hypothetical protein EW145_g852 [Phellinidium pouzarii]